MEISSSDTCSHFQKKKLFSNITSKSPQVQPQISCPTDREQILQARSRSSAYGTTTHHVLPPCTRAFRAMVDKHDCILLEHLLSPPRPSQNEALQVCEGCLPPQLQRLGWHDLLDLPCSWGQGTLLQVVLGPGQAAAEGNTFGCPKDSQHRATCLDSVQACHVVRSMGPVRLGSLDGNK